MMHKQKTSKNSISMRNASCLNLLVLWFLLRVLNCIFECNNRCRLYASNQKAVPYDVRYGLLAEFFNIEFSKGPNDTVAVSYKKNLFESSSLPQTFPIKFMFPNRFGKSIKVEGDQFKSLLAYFVHHFFKNRQQNNQRSTSEALLSSS